MVTTIRPRANKTRQNWEEPCLYERRAEQFLSERLPDRSVHLFHSPQCQLGVDLALALIKREREQKIASLTVGKRRQGQSERKKPCQMKRDLLLDHLSRLEKPKVAEREHKEILGAGTGDGAAARSAVRIKAMRHCLIWREQSIRSTVGHTTAKQVFRRSLFSLLQPIHDTEADQSQGKGKAEQDM